MYNTFVLIQFQGKLGDTPLGFSKEKQDSKVKARCSDWESFPSEGIKYPPCSYIKNCVLVRRILH